MIDAIDRQIIQVLSLQARAPFRTIAEVVGVSDQTVARRYRRLRDMAGLRVLGVVRAAQAGWVDWMIRLQTTPGGAGPIADALARRPDTRWVRLFSGGTEIVCVVQARTAEQRDALFLRGLPGSRRVVQISAQATLHTFSPVAWSGLTGALSPAQLAKLPSPPVSLAEQDPRGLEPAGLREGDDVLLAELVRDGRASNSALAAATHWHESTVRRRIAELTGTGLLYFDVDFDDSMYGIGVSAMLWLSVEPARLAEAGTMLAAMPEIPWAGAMTGTHNLAASGLFRDTEHLYNYLTGPLAALPGVRSVETAPTIGTFKRSGGLLAAGAA
jgi:DNA-binding Lrp family transcriptional regulator